MNKHVILINLLFLVFFSFSEQNFDNKNNLLNIKKQIETIEFDINNIHQIALKSGIQNEHKSKLNNAEKQISILYDKINIINDSTNQKEINEQNERLFRVSKLSFGMLVNKAWIIPFALLLLIIAFAPLIFHHWWENNFNKGLVCIVILLPVAIMLLYSDYRYLLHTGKEYISFIVLVGSLFIISGGIYLHGRLETCPIRNTIFLMFGAILANFIGTTGTAMVLFRPFIRANKHRNYKVHLIIFFIFIVCNIGGLLTPLGDPPLFLGFLRGVPFQWTLRMFPQWLFVNGILLLVFFIFDYISFKREPKKFDNTHDKITLSFHGKMNFVFLGGVVASAFLSGYYHLPFGFQETGMLLMVSSSLLYSPISSHERKGNSFTFGPFIEVSVIFAAIFVTMIPCLILLETWGQTLGMSTPAQFFWASGMLSQFLDNAPTYLTFSALASSLAGTDANYLNQLILNSKGALNLIAISCGSVFMGANSYIGNAPNFMVKALAEEHGIKMPSFFGYMLWAISILFPIYLLCTFIFF